MQVGVGGCRWEWEVLLPSNFSHLPVVLGVLFMIWLTLLASLSWCVETRC